MYMGDNRR